MIPEYRDSGFTEDPATETSSLISGIPRTSLQSSTIGALSRATLSRVPLRIRLFLFSGYRRVNVEFPRFVSQGHTRRSDSLFPFESIHITAAAFYRGGRTIDHTYQQRILRRENVFPPLNNWIIRTCTTQPKRRSIA